MAIGLGIQLWFWAPVEPPAWGALLAPAAALALWRVPGPAAAALFCVALGFSAATVRARVVAAPVLAAPLVATVEGRIRTIDQSRAGRPRLLLDRLHIYGLADDETPQRVRVTLLSARHGAGLAPGDHVSILAALSPPGGPLAPGAFDFRRTAWFARLGAIGLARSAPATLDPDPPTADIRLARLRAALAQGLRDRIPGAPGAFAAAVVAGDRGELPPEAVQALRDSNLAHLLAISGLHMAMTCGLVFAVARMALVLTPGAALRLPVKRIAAGVALLAGAAYLLVSGASVATQRAFVMAAAALVAVMADRPAVTMRALAAAATVVLLAAPESLTAVGFQMSFAATLALVAAFEAARARGWLTARDRSLGARVGRYAVGLVATSAIAGLATAPFAAFHFNRLTAWGLPANLAAVPAMGLWVAPALLAAGVAAPLGLEGAPLAMAAQGVEWILAVAAFFAALDGAARPVASTTPAALALVVAGGLGAALGWGRLRLAGGALAAAGLALWPFAGHDWDAFLAPEGRLAAVATAQGLAPDHPSAFGYAADAWLRRAGDGASQAEAAARPAWVEDGPWRQAPFGDGGALHVNRDRRIAAAALAERCRPGAVIAAPNALIAAPPEGSCIVLDKAALAAGAVALRAADGAVILARPGAGARLWSAPGAQ